MSTHDLTQGVVGRCVLSSKRGSALMPLQLEVFRTPSALHTRARKLRYDQLLTRPGVESRSR